jgi:hypothetical protein
MGESLPNLVTLIVSVLPCFDGINHHLITPSDNASPN